MCDWVSDQRATTRAMWFLSFDFKIKFLENINNRFDVGWNIARTAHWRWGHGVSVVVVLRCTQTKMKAKWRCHCFHRPCGAIELWDDKSIRNKIEWELARCDGMIYWKGGISATVTSVWGQCSVKPQRFQRGKCLFSRSEFDWTAVYSSRGVVRLRVDSLASLSISKKEFPQKNRFANLTRVRKAQTQENHVKNSQTDESPDRLHQQNRFVYKTNKPTSIEKSKQIRNQKVYFAFSIVQNGLSMRNWKKKLIECLPRNWFREKFEIGPKSARDDKKPLNGALFQARHLDGSWLRRQSAGGSSIKVDLAPEQVRNVSFRHPLIHRRANNRTWIRCKWWALSPEISIGRLD